MLDTKRLLDQFLGQPSPDAGGQQRGGGMIDTLTTGKAGLATGAVAGGLLGLLVGGKKSRKIAGKALGYGGMAVVGGLAYKAWQDWQANKAAGGPAPAHGQAPGPAPAPAGPVPEIAAPPADTPFQPAPGEAEQNLARALLRAMISAAKADGHIDAKEQKAIFERVEALQLDSDDKAFVMDELTKPLDVKSVADSARSPEEAAEIYAASLLAIDPEGAAEKGYLAMLAVRLQLDPELVQHLHNTVAAAQEPA